MGNSADHGIVTCKYLLTRQLSYSLTILLSAQQDNNGLA
jgi:hypothetical protein